MDVNTATLTRLSPTRDRSVEPQDASASASGGAFEAVLATLQGSAALPNVEASAPAASEVFEQASADPRRHRMETMRNDARQSDLRGEGQRASEADSNREFSEPQDAAAAGSRGSLRQESHGGASSATSPASAAPGVKSTGARVQGDSVSAEIQSSAGNSARATEPGGASRGSGVSQARAPRLPEATQPSSPASNLANSATPSGAGAVAERLAQWISQPSAGEAKAQGPTSAVASAAPTGSAARSGGAAPSPRSGESARPGEAPTPQSSGPVRDFEKLVHSIRLQQNGSRSRATLDLKPAELGRVRIEASMEDGRLELVIATQSAEAREVIAGRLTELREALQQQGVQPGAFELAPWNAEESAAWIAGGGESTDRRGENASRFEGETEQIASSAGAGTTGERSLHGDELASVGAWAPIDGRWDIRA